MDQTTITLAPGDHYPSELDGQELADEYVLGLAAATRVTHRTQLRLLQKLGAGELLLPDEGEQLRVNLRAFQGIDAGFLRHCRQVLLDNGRSVESINLFISITRTYVQLAWRAGLVDLQTWMLVKSIVAFSRRQAENIDAQRSQNKLRNTRRDPRVLAIDQQLALLDDQPESPVGKRDRLIISLGLLLGLRLGEIALLRVQDVDLIAGEMMVRRPKVRLVQRMTLLGSRRLYAAMRRYLNERLDLEEPALLLTSVHGELQNRPLLHSSVAGVVRRQGERHGIVGLSAHDLRHTWATVVAHAGTDALRLRDAGGWASIAQAARYAQRATVCNEGVIYPLELR